MKSIQKNKKISSNKRPVFFGKTGLKTGFTLVELIVVISILAILGTIAFLSFGGFSSKARDGSRISDTVSLSKGLELYSVKSGYYPKPEGALTEGIINGTLVTYKGEIQDQISSLTKISKTPKDPLSNNYYIYGTTLDYKQYQIATTLENSLSFQENIGEKVYADGPTYQAKVIGNYRGLLKYSSGTTTYLSNIPSLIYNTGALLDNNTYYSIDKSTNLPYKIQNAINGNKKANEILLQLTGTATTLTGISLSGITTKDEILANSGVLKMLGYDLSAIEKIVIGSSSISASTQDNTQILTPINGTCGTASGQTLSDISTITGLGACTTGSLSGSVLGTGPWTWTCGGSDGGANMNCSAQKIIPPPDSYTKLLLHGEDFTDSSTLNNSLTLSGNVVINSAYKKFGNSSIYFDGTGDYITTPQILVGTGEDFTIETWMYKTSLDNNGQTIIFSSTGGNIQFAADDGVIGKIGVYINGAVGVNFFGNAIVMNKWQHLAWVRSSGTIKTFVDGIYQGGGINTNSFNINKIGAYVDGGYEFHGYLDEIRISKGIARWTSDFAVPTLPY